MHPVGTFDAVLEDCGISETQNGKLFIAVQARTEHGVVFGRFSLEGNAAEHSIKKMRAAGWDGRDFGALNDASLHGRRISITTEEDEYDGKVRVQIAWINTAVEKSSAAAKRANHLLGRLLGNGNGTKAATGGGSASGEVPW